MPIRRTDLPRFHSILPNLLVADVRTTAEYYRDVLGFRIALIAGEDPCFFAIVDRDEGEGFHLSFDRGATGRRNRAGGGQALDSYIRIGDADRECATLRARGAHMISGPTDRPWQMRELEVEDANGYVHCFGSDVTGEWPPGSIRISPELVTANLSRSVAFYRDILGAEESAWGDHPGYAILRRDDVVLHLNQGPAGFAPRSNRAAGRFWDVFVEVSQLETIAEELRHRGARLLRGPETTDYDMREIEIADPDGYVLCLGEPVSGVW